MPTFDAVVDIDFEVFCDRCGEGLCMQSTTRTSRNRSYPQVSVEPCKVCLAEAREEGIVEGYDDGLEAGIEQGRREAEWENVG